MSTVNVKLGNSTYNGVDTIKLQDATTPATYHDFTLGGATPTFRVVNWWENIGNDGIFTTLQRNGVLPPWFPYIYSGEFDESYPYDNATGIMIPYSQNLDYVWSKTAITLNDGEVNAFCYSAERVYYSLVKATVSDVRDIETTLSTYGNIKVFVIDAELYAQSEHNVDVYYGTALTGEESFILNTITLTAAQVESFFHRENSEIDYEHISGRLMELPWSPLYENKYIMLGTNLMATGS